MRRKKASNTSITAVGSARTLTLNESLTVGDGSDGTITFSAASKTLTVEGDSIVNQDLTTDASPQFTGIELGHATDTTITRGSSGYLAVEGNAIYRAGGTDVPVADGGTGASTFTQNGALIGNAANAITAVDMSTKGGLLVGDGTGNPSVLAVGTNGLALVADSGEATGLKYASAGVGLGLVIALGG